MNSTRSPLVLPFQDSALNLGLGANLVFGFVEVLAPPTPPNPVEPEFDDPSLLVDLLLPLFAGE